MACGHTCSQGLTGRLVPLDARVLPVIMVQPSCFLPHAFPVAKVRVPRNAGVCRAARRGGWRMTPCLTSGVCKQRSTRRRANRTIRYGHSGIAVQHVSILNRADRLPIKQKRVGCALSDGDGSHAAHPAWCCAQLRCAPVATVLMLRRRPLLQLGSTRSVQTRWTCCGSMPASWPQS